MPINDIIKPQFPWYLKSSSYFTLTPLSHQLGEKKPLVELLHRSASISFRQSRPHGRKTADTRAGNSETRCRGRGRRCNIENLSRYKGSRTWNRNNSDSFARRTRKYVIQLIRFAYPDPNFHRLFFRRKMIGSHTAPPALPSVFTCAINVRRNFRHSPRSIGWSVLLLEYFFFLDFSSLDFEHFPEYFCFKRGFNLLLFCLYDLYKLNIY